MTLSSRITLFLLVLIACPVRADDAAAQARLQAWLNGLDTLQASFTQTVLDANLNAAQESSGVFYLMRPGKFRWNTTAPFEQVVVADGSNLWTYDPELEQVTVKPMQETLAASPASLLTGDVPVSEEFAVTEIGKTGELYWIRLQPKVQDTDFESLRVALNGEKLDTMELVDNLGQTTRIRFENVKRNLKLAPDTFEFIVPEGADVIGQAVETQQ